MNIKKIKGRVLYIIFIALAINNSSIAQSRLAIYGTEIRNPLPGGTLLVNKQVEFITSKIVNFFSNDGSFIIIDRNNLELINNEMELQKSESFIDGYIVDQGKAEGADYICRSFFNFKNNLMTIRIYDIASAKILCDHEKEFKSNLFKIVRSFDEQLTVMLNTVVSDCFDLGIPLVRITKEKKGKAKEVLILAGRSKRVKEGFEVEIIQKVEEKIGDKTLFRSVVIGNGKINKVEDDNFSTIKITKGQKEISEAIKSGSKLECKFIF